MTAKPRQVASGYWTSDQSSPYPSKLVQGPTIITTPLRFYFILLLFAYHRHTQRPCEHSLHLASPGPNYKNRTDHTVRPTTASAALHVVPPFFALLYSTAANAIQSICAFSTYGGRKVTNETSKQEDWRGYLKRR